MMAGDLLVELRFLSKMFCVVVRNLVFLIMVKAILHANVNRCVNMVDPEHANFERTS